MTTEEIVKVVQPYSSKAESIVKALAEAGALNITYGNEEVGKITDAFKQHFGVTKASKYDRWAASRLAKKHGSGNVVAVIQVMSRAQGMPFCPVINSISQLEDKWLSVAGFIQRNQVKEEIKL
jgi:hypothetical protein